MAAQFRRSTLHYDGKEVCSVCNAVWKNLYVKSGTMALLSDRVYKVNSDFWKMKPIKQMKATIKVSNIEVLVFKIGDAVIDTKKW